MAHIERAYMQPRSDRGLSDRVFLDTSNRRRSRVLLWVSTMLVAILVWVAVLVAALVSENGLSAALPDEIVEAQHGHDHSGPDAHSHALPDTIGGAAIKTYWQQDAAKYQCQVGTPAEAKQRVFAVIPAALPWAPSALNQSCNTIDVAVPEWFTLEAAGKTAQVTSVNSDTQAPVLRYTEANGTDVMPLIRMDMTGARLLQDAAGQTAISAALVDFAKGADDAHAGLCLSGDRFATLGAAAFATIAQPFAKALQAQDQIACISLPAGTGAGVLAAANTSFDTVMVTAHQQPWVGSAVQPLAAQDWFTKTVRDAQAHVDADKLVLKLGTHSVDWISGRPKPEIKAYADIMSDLASKGVTPTFHTDISNSFARYVDDQGLLHKVWMLNAASLHNQVQTLTTLGADAFAISSLGYEDPGIWAVLDQMRHDMTLEASSLSNVVVSDYVQHKGRGPFVAPLAMPEVGQRDVTLNDAGLITEVTYGKLPRASAARLYGGDQFKKVVLTFDDGPHPVHTPKALDILNAADVPGSFFVLGSAALQSPDLLQRIVAEGHELGSHTYSHPKMGEISASRATVEINSTQLLINGITGREMRLYREPYMRSGGPISSKEVASLMPLEQAGYVIAGMDIVPRDWLDRPAQVLAAEIIEKVEANAGGVVLLHDGGGDQTETIKALPIVIETLRAKGYEFTTIADYLGVSMDELMPPSDVVTSTFGNVSFYAVGKSWSLLEIMFWTVFGIGMTRAVILLVLTALRRRHKVTATGDLPSVSIVIPAYNEGRVIAKAIRRALATDYPNFDIIVVDDGSTDDTYAQAMIFNDLPNVTVIRQTNGGKASALNTALCETDAEVLVCLDADSQISSNAVAQMAVHFADPEVGAVAGRVVVGNRHKLLTKLQALEYITAQSVERRAKEALNAITVVPGAIGAWRANALLEAGVFSTETLTEDADMTMAVIRSDYRVVYEERAIATTETPATLSGLMTQRLRWSLGMMQATWKHKGAAIEGRKLGLISLPDLAIFGYLMPLIAPLADLFLILLVWDFFTSYSAGTLSDALVWGNPLLFAYVALPLVELITVVIAFQLDPHEDRRLMLLIPLQRVFYRQILYISVIRAMWRALTGSLAKWGRAPRKGYTYEVAESA